MLPLKLKMSAFCSYLDETIIDFTKFGKSGLYLITGDTGAGKTTIFDAISYALYGEASGDLRDPKLFRSKNALPETPTFVELTFSSKGKKYTIYRSPEYERPAKRGNGTVKSSAVATLTTYHGEEASTETLRKNDNRIDEIIGIDSQKFKQLSMIAQGAFMRVLNAETSEKTEILRAIFNTERFSMMQDELKATADQYKNDYFTLTNSMVSQLHRVTCAPESIYSEALAVMFAENQEIITGYEKSIALITDIITEDQSTVHDIEKLFTETEEKISKLHIAIGEATEREKTRRRYLEIKENLRKSQERLPEAEMQFEAIRHNEEQAAELEGQIHVLQEKLPDYEKLDSLQKMLASIVQNITAGNTSIAVQSKRLAEMQKLLSELKTERESLQDVDVLSEKLKRENAEYNTKISRYREILRDLKSYQKSVKDYNCALTQYTADRSDFEAKQQLSVQLNMAFLDEQAGIIAATLQPNMPCPVCGSSEHPHIACKTENAPTKEQVNEAMQEADKASEKVSQSAAECSRAKAVCDQYQKAIKSAALELYQEVKTPEELYASVEAAGIALKKKIEANKAQIDQYEAQKNRREAINIRLSKIEKDGDTLRTEVESLRTDCAVLEQRRAGIKENIDSLEKSLPFSNKSELNSTIQKLSQTKIALQQAYKSAEKALNDCRSMIQAQQAALKSFGQVNEVSETETIAELTNETSNLTNANITRRQAISDLKMRIRNNKWIQDYLTQHVERQQELEKLYVQISELSNTANGKLTGGKDKVTLEVFAQARYFDSILSLANLRLMKMSNGKYEFRRSERALEKRGKSGLDIDVLDHDSITNRSVRSLSGGESFMASLSLALGFSDVIQSTVGGVHLETMFIDEGFGTLDEKSLENAYQVFEDLSQQGNCLIGIISHVEDLKSRITNRLVVTKDTSGNSHVRIENSYSHTSCEVLAVAREWAAMDCTS